MKSKNWSIALRILITLGLMALVGYIVKDLEQPMVTYIRVASLSGFLFIIGFDDPGTDDDNVVTGGMFVLNAALLIITFAFPGFFPG